MLSKLTINNVALISKLELDFCNHLNILSGETGAGKSIIVDSLMLLLGARYDKSLLSYGETFGFVEGVFITNESIKKSMKGLGIEEDELLIINRKFFDDSKTEIRINGRMVTTAMLKQLMTTVVDIYGQNEYQSLIKQSEHIKILDYYVKHSTIKILEKLSLEYQNYTNIKKEIAELGDLSQRERNIDMLKFQLDEINNANIQKNEEEELLDLRKKILSVEKINSAFTTLIECLEGNEDISSAQTLISTAYHALSPITALNSDYEELHTRLDSISIELTDIIACATNELSSLNFDLSDLDKLEKRLDIIKLLKKKYGNFDKMLQFKENSEELLYKLENSTVIYDKLVSQKLDSIKVIHAYCCELSNIRREGAIKLEENIVNELSQLGMNESKFKIIFEPIPPLEICENRLSANGFDCLEFYLSPNAGQPLKPLLKIISGGEMSRFMLALKVISSETDDIPTLIFDEIDTGISGAVGQAVAKKLARISRKHQILCVTHLPQIASMADNHYFIAKEIKNGNTSTGVKQLSREEMIEEVSRLSGGKDISAQSHLNALEMKNWSDEYKISLN